MATFIFDGTTNITAAKTDTVVITANPALFTSVADSAGNSVFNFSGKSLTITGTAFGLNTTSYPGVSVAGGTFSTASTTTVAATGANDLVIAPTGTVNATVTGAASDVTAIFGGLGVSDSIDGADTINFGGKGSFLVYGNGGNDTIAQGQNDTNVNGAFDSTSFVTVFGGKGDDGITLGGGLVNGTTAAATTNSGAKLAIYGGEGTDTIVVQNTGSSANTFIAGGQGAADSSDAADNIRFIGGGTVNIFGNAGGDTINVGGTNTATGVTGVAGSVDSTANITIHGGLDGDTININVGTTAQSTATGNPFVTTGSVKATIVAYGDEGADTINVLNNAGTTVIYGDTAAADSAGGVDTITYSGQGTATIYAAGGNDLITLAGRGNATADSTSTTTVFGGNGNDSVTITAHTDTIGAITITNGAGADSVQLTYNSNSTTPGAVTGQNITITDFTPGAGNDVLKLTTGSGQAQANVVAGSFQTLQQALDAATTTPGAATTTTAGTVAVVAFQGSSYVVVNDGNLGFNATADLAVKLTGVTDVTTVLNSIAIA